MGYMNYYVSGYDLSYFDDQFNKLLGCVFEMNRHTDYYVIEMRLE